MRENKAFVEFEKEFIQTANYYVTADSCPGNGGGRYAVSLCMAYAFEAGLKAPRPKRRWWRFWA